MITLEDFLKEIRTIKTKTQKEQLCEYEHLDIFQTYFEKLYYVYICEVAKISEQEKNKKKEYKEISILVSQIAVFRLMIDIVIGKLKLFVDKSDNIKSIFKRLKSNNLLPDIFIGIIQEYINYFNTKYEIDLELIKNPNHHSLVKSLKKISDLGYSKLLDGMTNPKVDLGYGDDTPESITWLILHESRRNCCKIPFDESSIIGFFQSLVKGKKLVFEKFGIGLCISFKCPCNLSISHQIKKGFDIDEKKELLCNKQIKLVCSQDNLQVPFKIRKGNCKLFFSKEQNIEYYAFFRMLIQSYKYTAFPREKIVFCPKEGCYYNSVPFIINEKNVSTTCPMCIEIFCTDCNVFQTHPDNGILCNQSSIERLKELGDDVKLCPNFPKCQIPINRIEGCDKMICSISNGGCDTSFCWLCNQKTAIQNSDIKDIIDYFISINSPIEFVSTQSYLYIHINNSCPNANSISGVFHPQNIINTWVPSDIVYKSSRQLLSPEHTNIIISMMEQAMIKNKN